MYLARFAFVYARARADVFFFLSVAGKFATHVGINPFTRVAKINRVSRNHREDRRRETDIQNNFFSSQQTTQLTQFSAVSSQFKNRTVAKVRAFRTIWVVFLYHKKSSHNEKRRGENERLIAISDNVEFLSRLSLSRFSFGTESEDTDERGEKGSFLFGYFFARRGSRFINNMNTNSASSTSGTSHRDQKLRVWWIKIVLCRSFREFFFCTQNDSLMETFYHFLRMLTFYYHQSIITNKH